MNIVTDFTSAIHFYHLSDSFITDFNLRFDGFHTLTRVLGNSQEDLPSNTDVYWGNRILPQTLESCPNLSWIHFGSSGTNRLHQYQHHSDIIVTNSRTISTPEVVTSVVAFMTSFARGFNYLHPLHSQKIYSRHECNLFYKNLSSLFGSSILICGNGHIGHKLVDICSAFDMDIHMLVRSCPTTINNSVTYITLDSILSCSHEFTYVVNCMPLNVSTYSFFDSNFFNHVHTQCFINVGRGESVDEPALLDALNSNTVSFASLDVLSTEPFDLSSPITSHPKVFLTPHVAAMSPNYWPRQISLFESNLEFFSNNQLSEMLNLVPYPY